MIRRKILAASENAGKLRELRSIFAELLPEVEIVTPSEIGLAIAYPAEGADYVANAVGKATAAAHASGLGAFADDSGIEVDALGGRPGPASARYGASDAERIDRLLRELRAVPAERRGARFRSVAAMVEPNGAPLVAEGTWEGVILPARRGAGGFGYDPVFLDREADLAAAEMTTEEKAARSHRGKALRALAKMIRTKWDEAK